METPKPTGIRLSQQWLDSDAQQRKPLSQIWVQVRARDEHTLRRLGFGQEDIDHDLAILSADSDPEHLASIEKRNAEIHAEMAVRHAKKVAALRILSIKSSGALKSQRNLVFQLALKSRPENSPTQMMKRILWRYFVNQPQLLQLLHLYQRLKYLLVRTRTPYSKPCSRLGISRSALRQYPGTPSLTPWPTLDS